jgi:4-azaleucine resistance transporter AzlC
LSHWSGNALGNLDPMSSGPLPQRGVILRAAIGIGVYAGAFGAAFGAVSVASGLSMAQTMVLSLVMFSGASQFAFVGVAASAGSPFSAVGPALLLGVRNALYGVPVSEVLHPGGWLRLLAAQLVVDETTAMTTGQSTERAKTYAFWATGLILFALWQLGSLGGAVLGRAIDPAVFGLDAAAPAVFLALLWPRLRNRGAAWVAICGAAVAILLVPVVPQGVPVIAAAAVALIAGMLPGQRARHVGDPAEP